jgi:hypothetical protein
MGARLIAFAVLGIHAWAFTNVTCSCSTPSSLPKLIRKLQAYNSGLVTMDRVTRDAHLLPLTGASYMRVDVGMGWAHGKHMPGIFGDVVKDFSLKSYDPSPILTHSRLMATYNVTPIYSWCYNPFEADYTKPPANLSDWKELHRRIAAELKSNSLQTVHELYNEPDLSWAFTGSWEEYLHMSVAAAQGIKSGDPDAIIIGPAAAIPSADKLASLLKLVKTEQLPLDALSIHAYGAGIWQKHVKIAKDALAAASVQLPIHLNEVNVIDGGDPTAAAQLESYSLASRVLSTMHELLEHEEVGMANWAQFLESGEQAPSEQTGRRPYIH